MSPFHLSSFLVLGLSLVLSLVKFYLFNKKAITKINCKINNKPILDHICTISIYRAFQEFTFAVGKNIFTQNIRERYISAKVRKLIQVKSSNNEILKPETVSSNACNYSN